MPGRPRHRIFDRAVNQRRKKVVQLTKAYDKSWLAGEMTETDSDFKPLQRKIWRPKVFVGTVSDAQMTVTSKGYIPPA